MERSLLKHLNYDEQIRQIVEEYRYLGKPVINIDATGVGEPIVDQLRGHGINNIEPYVFTDASRTSLLANLQILLEQGRIRIPDDPFIVNEFKSMEYQLSERGKVKIAVPHGLHDDHIMAIALACFGFGDKKRKYESNKKFVDLKAIYPWVDKTLDWWNCSD